MKKTLILTLIATLFFAVSVSLIQASTVTKKISITKKTASKVYIKWNKVNGANKYSIRLVTQNKKKLIRKKIVKKNFTIINGLDANVKYQVKVKAKINGQYQKNSTPKKFQTKKGKLYLSGEKYNHTVNWEDANGTDNTYILVWSKSHNPVYPNRCTDKASYFYYPGEISGEITAFDGAGTYYVRVCSYTSTDKCDAYSNEIAVKLKRAPDLDYDPLNEVDYISLFYVPGYFGCTKTYNIFWYGPGYAEDGFQLVYSKNPNPQYPTRSGDYNTHYKKPGQWMGKVKAEDGPGTYYARVCSFYGNTCWAYSNQITIEL